jgi:hypothetical protein
MNKQHNNLLQIIWRSILILALIAPAMLTVNIQPVQAGGGGIPIIGLIPALIKRNRVYKTANNLIREEREYYDALRDTAAQALLDRNVPYAEYQRSQTAGYIKAVALIEQERKTLNDYAESEKKAAHDEWIGEVQNQITGVMLSTTPAIRVFGAFNEGINSSQGFITEAINKLTGGSGGFLADVAKVRRIAERMEIAGQVIGGDLGKALRRGSSTVARLTKPIDLVEADLIQVQQELGALQGKVNGMQDQGYTPEVSQTTREVAVTLVTGEGRPTISLIADGLIAAHGGGGDMRERARAILLGKSAARCAARVEEMRKIIYRMQVDPAGEEENHPGMFPICTTAEIPSLIDEPTALDPSIAEDIAAAEEDESIDTEQEQEEIAEGEPTIDEGETADTDQDSQEDSTQPQDKESDEALIPSSETEFIWVLVSSVANPFNERTSYTGGTGDPVYFGEARFAGKSLDYTASDGFFSVHAADVDHGYTYADTTVSVSFDSPPAQLEPGQEISLSATASHSGSVNEGGAGQGLLFQYSYLKRALEPILDYRPYNPSWEGSASQDWIFTVPIATSTESEFELWAGLWNSPPCSVVWKYEAQRNPNYTEGGGAEPDQDAGQPDDSPPTGTEADPYCAAQRQEVADKVSIARGADTADLALGIVGYVRVARGDVQLNFCEGGGAQAEKGTVIRAGDCIKTGKNGRTRFVLNDRDTKYNAEPTDLGLGRNSEICFEGFTVHRDDGKPGWIDHIRGYIRVITRGWSQDNGLGVRVSVKAAVTIASDVILEYDPDLDLLRTYVNEGNVEVEDLNTGESETLQDNQLLISPSGTIGSVERMSKGVWNDLIEEQGLDLEESDASDSLISLDDPFRLPNWAIALIVTGICGGGILLLGGGAFLLYRRNKTKRPVDD